MRSPHQYRIAVVAACPFPARRGTPLRVERLTAALVERGHEVELVTYHLADEVYDLPFPVHRVFGRTKIQKLAPGPTIAKLSLYDPAMVPLLRRLVRRHPFDAIHAHHFEGLLVAAVARGRARIPIVYDAHTMLASELPSYRTGLAPGIARTIGRWLDRRIPALANHTVTVTQDIRRRLIAEHSFDPDTISVATNGVEADRFSQVDASAGVADTLFYSGTLAAYQGVDLMLRAFALAREVRPTLRLICSVSSSFVPFEEMARNLGIRSAITLQDDSFEELPQRLANVAIALLPRPTCDGIPQKLLNYMAAGKPVVAFRDSAKVLTHEQTGLVVENGDVEGFAKAVLRLAENSAEARRMGEVARQYVLGNCTWDRTAAACERVYDLLLSEQRLTSSGNTA